MAETAEDVSRIAFGFMASKALFAGLHIDVFTQLASGPKTSAQISDAVKVPINRITTLMTALNSIGLVERDKGEIYIQILLAPNHSYQKVRNMNLGIICGIRLINKCILF